MYDVLILGGTVVDGSGSPAYPADVGVSNGTVQEIGDLVTADARRTIDASGLVAAPGFIDTHTHSDGALLIDPQHANGIRQGVTTEIIGQDGLSYAPLSRENYLLNRWYLSGILGLPPEEIDTASVDAFLGNYHRKVAVNVAYPVPHAAVRLETVGFHDKPLRGDDLERAKAMVREGMEQGAVGLATGMSYFPNAWSDTEELVELCNVVAEQGGVYVTHLRDVNVERGFGGGGVTEALEIGRRSGVKVHFSHHRTQPHTAGQTAQLMEEIDKASAVGVDSTQELYPYPSGSTYALRHLPSEVSDGGPSAVVQRLRDPRQRRKMVEQMEEYHAGHPSLGLAEGVFSYLPSGANSHLVGVSFQDAAQERGVSIAEMVCDILLEEELAVGYFRRPPANMARWRQVNQDAVELLSRQDYMVGSDSIPAHTHPHPRAYGTFPRLLGRLRRKYSVLTLEAMVQRMTDNPARRFGLEKRGRLEKGHYADIVVFDPDRINDTATYDDPKQYPTGIPFVLINGQVAVDQGRCTGVLAGQAVR